LGKTRAEIRCLTLGNGFVLKGTKHLNQALKQPFKKQLFFY
jgi:hypothetical protein